ncbi:pore-forming ESAT-6 family protein [Bosea lathyri]|uniref:Uncharacterized protein n=1 Tax=Bosea lathyri TaxID=1036778 RepID=A0A1H5VU45_9HYPH|nr:pore-forming ESAT-6 family protein [Bosea lathyri]SEF90516.1 hypothetical protein SAMN04488115_102427 [Bosea lathyri]
MISFAKPLCIAAAVTAFLASGSASHAQTQADQLKLAYQAGRNQIGLMAYCADKGFVGADVVEIQKNMIGMIPVPADKSAGDAAEAQGRKGTIAAMGMEQDIEAIAKAQNGTAATFCKQVGDAIKQAGAALPK